MERDGPQTLRCQESFDPQGSFPKVRNARVQCDGEIQEQSEGLVFRGFIQVLSKSRSTLRVLSIDMSTIPEQLLKDLLIALDYRNMGMVDLRIWEGKDANSPNDVKILRRSPSGAGEQVPEADIALQVLWTTSLPELLFGTEFVLHSLVSLKLEQAYDALTLHTLIKPLSAKLKHLNIRINIFRVDEHWELEPLQFPQLEVLEFISNRESSKFPRWILCPSSLKLGSYDIHQEFPSISELSIQTLEDCTPLSGRCPLLHTFRLKPYGSSVATLNLSNLVKLLIERRAQVEARMEVDGIKMQNIKTVVLPFCWFWSDDKKSGAAVLEDIKSLVETVIDSDGEKWITI